MNFVFADTFYFIALLSTKDQFHKKAVKIGSSIDALLTTEWVMTELADGLASTAQRPLFVQFRQDFSNNPKTKLVSFEMPLYESGLQLYASHPTKTGPLPIAFHSSSCSSIPSKTR